MVSQDSDGDDECYYANQSHIYNGYVSSTNRGACFNWTSFPDNYFIDGNRAKAKNYCRDPDYTGYPYCFTSSGRTPCTIPQCIGMCKDDPNTKCEDLKTLLCQSDHFAKLMCPKSCNVCGFGLLEPVHIDPPVIKDCADDPMARCDQLKELICADHAKATLYCPRTCNVCGASNTIGVTGMESTTRTISTPPPIITHREALHITTDIAYSTIGVTSMRSTTTMTNTLLQPTTEEPCVDLANFSCNNPEIKALICIDVPVATNVCRKTCNLCGTAVVKIVKEKCGDPLKLSMCQLLHEEVCLCYDQPIFSVLCPHYCAGECGDVSNTVRCPGPTGAVLIGRR
ncbi:hypothetical protein CHS0354_010500 [Potamilus streckersoni]|uniref:Uncharacterized protein n=1 Tax=Potamilus streckersoni TaxID=2493646 RepID=A0AAE0T5F7_9BIVA|nr:hypothetical protein CHS0354_010500 [Potamilus streckersoni]